MAFWEPAASFLGLLLRVEAHVNVALIVCLQRHLNKYLREVQILVLFPLTCLLSMGSDYNGLFSDSCWL